jgi:hypothetical protein
VKKLETKTWKGIVMLVVVGCYVAAVLLPAFRFTSHIPPDPIVGEVEIYPGWFVLVFGPMGIIFLEQSAFAWLANCTFVAGILFYGFGRFGSAAAFAMTSAILGASFFWTSKSHPMRVLFSGRDDFMNHPIPMLGFFFWMSSFAILFVGALLGKLTRRARPKRKGVEDSIASHAK